MSDRDVKRTGHARYGSFERALDELQEAGFLTGLIIGDNTVTLRWRKERERRKTTAATYQAVGERALFWLSQRPKGSTTDVQIDTEDGGPATT